ncbi:36105_t:CDS:2, partial [Racocetra persica]
LEEYIHDEVKSILGIREHQYLKPREIYQEHLKLPNSKYQVIMTGCEKIQSSVVYHRITFQKRLESNDFLLYGSITNESGKQIDNVIIKFRSINNDGFSVTIENFTGHEMEHFGNRLNINWMLVGDPDVINYRNPYVQNYFVAKVGTKIFNNKDLEGLNIELPQPLKNVKNARFACTFYYSSNDGPSFSTCIESNDAKGIRLHIKNLNNKTQTHLTTFDEFKMHWCIYFIPIKKIIIGQFIPVNQSSSKMPKFLRTKSSKQVPGLRIDVYEAISAFRVILPWFDALNIILEKISKAYEEAEYNRKTCRVLTDRADDVLTAVKILFRRRDEEEDKFLDDYYVKSFIKLHRVLRDIKEFISNISQLQGLSKFVSAEDIRKRCIFLMNELESTCLDLDLHTTISVEDKRLVQKSLMEDVETMTEFLETIKGGVIQDDIKDIRYKKEVVIPKTSKMPSKVFDEVAEIKKKMEKKEIRLNAPRIDPDSLQEDKGWIQKDECRIFKRLLNGKIEVACKRIKIPDSEFQMFNTRFAILNRLKSGKREHLNFDNNCPRCITTGLSRIIQTAWAHEPSERPCINAFNAELNKLRLSLKNNYTGLNDESPLFYYGVLSLDGKYVEKDENIGIQCLELATAKGQKQAIDELKKRNINF